MEQDVEERNQQRDRETIEQRRKEVANDRDRHAPGVRAQVGEKPSIDWRLHLIRVIVLGRLAKLMRCPPSPVPPPATQLSARSEQRQRENYFFGRHAAVQERSAITALVLAQLGRIDEEAIAAGEQSVATGAATRQSQHVLIREQ